MKITLKILEDWLKASSYTKEAKAVFELRKQALGVPSMPSWSDIRSIPGDVVSSIRSEVEGKVKSIGLRHANNARAREALSEEMLRGLAAYEAGQRELLRGGPWFLTSERDFETMWSSVYRHIWNAFEDKYNQDVRSHAALKDVKKGLKRVHSAYRQRLLSQVRVDRATEQVARDVGNMMSGGIAGNAVGKSVRRKNHVRRRLGNDWMQDFDNREDPRYEGYDGPFVKILDNANDTAWAFTLVKKDGTPWPRSHYPTESDISSDERFTRTYTQGDGVLADIAKSMPGANAERPGWRGNFPFKGKYFHLFFEGGALQLKAPNAPSTSPHSGGSHLDEIGTMDISDGSYSVGGIIAHNIDEVNLQSVDSQGQMNIIDQMLASSTGLVLKKMIEDIKATLELGRNGIMIYNTLRSNLVDKIFLLPNFPESLRGPMGSLLEVADSVQEAEEGSSERALALRNFDTAARPITSV